MHHKMPMVAAGLIISMASVSSIAATDLLTVYRLGVQNEDTYKIAKYTSAADREELPKAQAAMLPNVSYTGTSTRDRTVISAETILGKRVTRDPSYLSESGALLLRQPLYRPQLWAGYVQAEAVARRADAVEEKERQSMAVRVAEAYFDVLLAEELLTASRSQTKSYERLLGLVQQAFSAGAGTIIDVYDVKARLDQAKASELEAANGVKNGRKALETLVKGSVAVLKTINEQQIKFEPSPMPLEKWEAIAETSSAEIATLQKEVAIAEQEIRKADSGHYPALDLIASHKVGGNETESTLNQQTYTDYVGVQLTIPIFAGGYVSASVRQASSRLEIAQQKYDAMRYDVKMRVGKEYANLEQSSARALALTTALESTELALKATEKGASVGTRTVIDVLTAQDQVYKTRVDLAKARYLYVLSYLRLHAVAGILGDDQIALVNSWLK